MPNPYRPKTQDMQHTHTRTHHTHTHTYMHTHTTTLHTHTHTRTHIHRVMDQGNETEVESFLKRKVFKEDLKLTEVEQNDWQEQGAGSIQLEPGKRKDRWPLDFVQKDGILNTQVSAEERSCREGTTAQPIPLCHLGFALVSLQSTIQPLFLEVSTNPIITTTKKDSNSEIAAAPQWQKALLIPATVPTGHILTASSAASSGRCWRERWQPAARHWHTWRHTGGCPRIPVTHNTKPSLSQWHTGVPLLVTMLLTVTHRDTTVGDNVTDTVRQIDTPRQTDTVR